MRPTFTVAVVFTAAVFSLAAAESELFREFVRDRAAGKTSVLSDYSYAGYDGGAKAPEIKVTREFDVTAYGALPNDELDDRAGIQRAIDAAAAAGGGVVRLPRGRYIVNSDPRDVGEISITSSNIVIKGDGASADGTVIHQIEPFRNGDMNDPTRMHLKKSLFAVRSLATALHFLKHPKLAKIAAPVSSGSFSVTVDDSSKIKVGDHVVLAVLDKRVIEKLTKPYKIDAKWTVTTENRAASAEIHRVAAVSGSTVTFAEPLRYDLDPEIDWRLLETKLIDHVGIEDIMFFGNAYAPYYHHRSDRDDLGWSFIRMKGTDSSWVRRCVFVDASQTVCVSFSRYPTLLNLVVVGNPGHHIPRSAYFNYGLLGGWIDDRAGFTHGPSLQGGCVGTVYLYCRSQGAPDSHAGRPYVSLFDCNTGGRLNSTGGVRDYPQHLRGLVLWNFNNTAKNQHYDFWKRGKNNCFVLPVIAGFHGESATFEAAHIGKMESYGTPVEPKSLYLAQLALRLGAVPDWVAAAEADAAAQRQIKLPPRFDFKDPTACGIQFMSEFDVGELVGEQCELSLFMYDTVPFEFIRPEKPIPASGDRVMLAHAVYMMMNVLARENTKSGNSITACAEMRDGVPGALISLKSGRLKNREAKLDSAPWFAAAKWLAPKLGGAITSATVDGRLTLTLWIPLRGVRAN